MSMTILCKLFGHMRRDIDMPLSKAMEAFFVPKGDKFPGWPITILPTIIRYY